MSAATVDELRALLPLVYGATDRCEHVDEGADVRGRWTMPDGRKCEVCDACALVLVSQGVPTS